MTDFHDIKKFKHFKRKVDDLGLKFPVAEISKRTGHSKSNVSKYINGKLEPSEKFYNDFQKNFNIVFESSDTTENSDSSIILLPAESKVHIPYYDIDFAGGWNSDEIFSTINPSFYINSPDFYRSEFACNLVGHSISRIIPSGSVIGLREVQDWHIYFPTNELYGVVMRNGLRTVKIVKRNRENKNVLILLPDCLAENDKTGFEPEEVPIDFIIKLYQVTAWAKFERLTM
ncbi:hypothetical protein [Elizabethkingia anophelis]|uniref:hypothetical protein n=1 Tax=Elizabethkingia anophelis TaxID=1117645 RepID=UPI002011E0DA|nr:hypothetical protein [Elizabethkingia anophelis]MCL1689631.1 hypothetical protein [Elizabethkingia anophelis]